MLLNPASSISCSPESSEELNNLNFHHHTAQELEKATAEEEGNDIVDLKKSTTDNYQFTSYAEFKDKESFMDHLKSGACGLWGTSMRPSSCCLRDAHVHHTHAFKFAQTTSRTGSSSR